MKLTAQQRSAALEAFQDEFSSWSVSSGMAGVRLIEQRRRPCDEVQTLATNDSVASGRLVFAFDDRTEAERARLTRSIEASLKAVIDSRDPETLPYGMRTAADVEQSIRRKNDHIARLEAKLIVLESEGV